MENELFRKQSLDKVKSPESLNDYVRISRPGIWLLLATVLVLLIGAFTWGALGYVDTTVKTDVILFHYYRDLPLKYVKNNGAFTK